MKIIDISRTLNNELSPWPGDVPFAFRTTASIGPGCPVNIGAITSSVHNGTHADAPFHFDPNGKQIDTLPLSSYLGRAIVVDLSSKFLQANNSRSIGVSDLESASERIAETNRLLIKTKVWSDSAMFPGWIPILETDVPAWLEKLGVVLIGMDVPSMDELDSKQLPIHHALALANIAIVESLDLSLVEAGIYHFAAVPLKIAGGDGAPVRAVLWTT